MRATWSWTDVQALPPDPGVYRLIIETKGHYIGESKSLSGRWRNYTHPGSTQLTARRIHGVIGDNAVNFQVMVNPQFAGTPMDLSFHLSRLMMESAAIQYAKGQGHPLLNITSGVRGNGWPPQWIAEELS